jgi:hypothetical protein
MGKSYVTVVMPVAPCFFLGELIPALLQTGNYVLCCDDEKARRVGMELAGEERVIGSLRLLKWIVAEDICTCDDAFVYYERMKAAGGFLPELSREWFESK